MSMFVLLKIIRISDNIFHCIPLCNFLDMWGRVSERRFVYEDFVFDT